MLWNIGSRCDNPTIHSHLPAGLARPYAITCQSVIRLSVWPSLFPSRARQGTPAPCLDRELFCTEVGDPRYPTNKIRSVVRQEASLIRRTITQHLIGLAQRLF
jgi:hypothetical protein